MGTYRQYANSDPEVPVSRPSRLTAALVGLLCATGALAAPAASTVAIPVDCSDGPVELARDDLHYDLDGTCGVVRITASNATVSMPTGVRVVVRGTGNELDAKSLDTLVVRGRGHDVRPTSVRRMRLGSPASVVAVEGLVERALVGRHGSAVSAGQISSLDLRGRGHTVRSRRGFDAAVEGAGNEVAYRRLEELAVSGDRNRVRVRRGVTVVRDTGVGNRIRVARRG